MNDSADIKNAADRLQSALAKLENSLTPLLQDLNRLESVEKESIRFKADRADLAAQLDHAKARSQDFDKREAEFTELTNETITELDRVIRQVNTVLQQQSSGQ